MNLIAHNDNTEVQTTIPATAADGLGEILDLGTARLWALQLPAAWTAAAITLRASSDGAAATFADVYMSGTEYTIDAAAGRYVVIGADLLGLQFLQLRSGTAGTPVQQAADRALKLICLSRVL